MTRCKFGVRSLTRNLELIIVLVPRFAEIVCFVLTRSRLQNKNIAYLHLSTNYHVVSAGKSLAQYPLYKLLMLKVNQNHQNNTIEVRVLSSRYTTAAKKFAKSAHENWCACSHLQFPEFMYIIILLRIKYI